MVVIVTPSKKDLERLRAQEEWGKWNTAPLANRIYGKPWKGWDYIMPLICLQAIILMAYAIWSKTQ